MSNIIGSDISLSADVDNDATVINSKIGERCVIYKNCSFCYSSLGDMSYISRNTHVFSFEIGRYTSISWNVSIGPANHDPNRISSHSMLFAKRFGMTDNKFYNQYENRCIIGNDVWIGCGVTIMRGVTIGDGAVIGANSVITKDVAPYSVVGGINRFIRWRFDKDIRERLLEMKWWNYPLEVVKDNIDILALEPTLPILDIFEKKLQDSKNNIINDREQY